MKECKTPPIIGKTPMQVLPSPDFVDGLVLDELFQNERRCFPTDALDAQKAPVEPRLQHVHHVSIEGLELRMLSEEAAKFGSDRDDRRRPVRYHIQDPKQ